MPLRILPVPAARSRPITIPLSSMIDPSPIIIRRTAPDWAPSDGVRFHTVEADNRQAESEASKDGEHRRAGADNPKLEVAVEMLGETLQRQDRQRGINFAHRPAEEVGGASFASRSHGMEADKQVYVALKPLCERNVNLPGRIFFKQSLLCGGNDAHDLDRLFPGIAAEIAGHADGAAAPFCFWRVVAGVLDALPERVAVRPKLLREDVVDDSDHRTAGLGGFGL